MRRSVDTVPENVRTDLEQNVLFSGDIVLEVDGSIAGAESFAADFSDGIVGFEIGFGCPTRTEWRATSPLPFDAHIYDNVSVSETIRGIAIGPQSLTITPLVGNLGASDRDTSSMFIDGNVGVLQTQYAYQEFNLTSENYAISFGFLQPPSAGGVVEKVSLGQLPITFVGRNIAPCLSLDSCDKVHIAFQSYRDSNWEIYYTSNYDQGNPFRFDTRITNDPGNSLAPSVGIDGNGRRLIAWHDDRTGHYQIFAARSNAEINCHLCDNVNQQLAQVADAGQDTDEYTMYAGLCEFSYPFIASASGSYHFRISFYTDQSATQFYKAVDSRLNVAGWEVNGSQLPYNGFTLTVGESCVATYDASEDDDLIGTLYYVRIEAFNGSSIIEETYTEIFYCPTQQVSRCTIPVTYTNASHSSENLNFRVIAYNDSARTTAVLVADTAVDPRGWVFNNTQYNGSSVFVSGLGIVSAYYDPNFLPPNLFYSQDLTNPQSLLCNVTYYISVFVKIGSGSYDIADEFAITCDCTDTTDYQWGQDKQSNAWICSGQGSDDVRISLTDNDALLPKVSASADGAIYIAWEDQRYNNGLNLNNDPESCCPPVPSAFYGLWDANTDQFYCSAQGYYDHRLNATGRQFAVNTLMNSLQYPSFFYFQEVGIAYGIYRTSCSSTCSACCNRTICSSAAFSRRSTMFGDRSCPKQRSKALSPDQRNSVSSCQRLQSIFGFDWSKRCLRH